MTALPSSEIKGHRTVLDSLTGLLESNRVPHALLFCGPEGVGKRMVADQFVAARLCANRNGVWACGDCPSCEAIRIGRHPDLFVLRRGEDERSIGIDGVHELKAFFALRSSLSAVKAVVIDEADRLTDEAQNSLLKLLEEPPPGSVMVLVTSRHRELLATVLSRCRRIEFGPLDSTSQSQILAQSGGVPVEVAAAAATLSGGSVSRALALIEKNGPELYEQALSRLERSVSGDPVELEERGAQDRGEDEEFLGLVAQVLRDVMRVKSGNCQGLYMPLSLERLRHIAVEWDADALLVSLERVAEAREALAQSGNSRIVLNRFWAQIGARWI